jgi:hypothetical protein
VRLAVAVALAFIVIAGGLAAIVAVLVIVFNLAWDSQFPGTQGRRPGDHVTRLDEQDGQRR